MASYYVNLPAPRMPRNAMLDFSGVNNALDSYQAQQNRNRQFGMQEQQLGMDRERLQLAKNADARAGEDQAWQKEQRLAQKFGALAQVIRDDPNPATAMANWQKLTQRVPQLAQKLAEYGIDPNDYKSSTAYLMAEAGKHKSRQQMEMERLQLAQARQGLESGGLDLEIKKRDLNAPSLKTMIVPEGATAIGINPRTGQHQVLAQGERKIDATTKKAIDEADEFAAQNKTAVELIDRAIALNSQANAGKGAGFRATLSNNLPDALVPDFVSSPQSGQATVDLDNLVTSQALQSLRSTFGANPTEGERQILMEVAGSVDMPREARARIYQRARDAAQSRLERNAEKARALRAGTYFTPNYQPGKPQDNLSGTQNTNEAAVKQQAEAQRVINGRTYYKIGGQWYDAGN